MDFPVSAKNVEGGYGVKGMRWLSPVSRAFRKQYREHRHLAHGRCSRGYRRSRTGRGCVSKSEERSPRRKYTRRMGAVARAVKKIEKKVAEEVKSAVRRSAREGRKLPERYRQ
jgi:hypothetical protein